jgi:hypothetical protein
LSITGITNRTYSDKKNFEDSLREASKVLKKQYTDPLNIPNFFSFFKLPSDTIHYVKTLKEARFHKEQESILEAKFRLCNTAANAAYSFSALASTLTVIRELTAVGNTFPFIGIIASTISGGMEINNFAKQYQFISQCKHSLKKLKKDPNDFSAFNFLQKFTPNSREVNTMQLIRLSKRVKPWYAEKLATELPSALEKKEIIKATELLKNANIQAQKKAIRHILSFFCNFLILGACISLIAGAPYAVVIILFALVCIPYGANYLFGRGVDQIGWTFNLKPCLFFWKDTHSC